MKCTAKLPLLSLLALLMIPVFFTGCGSADSQSSVPDGATITVNPAEATWAIVDNVSMDFAVTVKDKDGNPINNAPLRITGTFAEPRNATNTTARYQFYARPGGENDPNNTKVNSGFTAQTDYYGVYVFSVTIYGTVGGVPNAFTDNINIYSGTAFNQTSLSINN